MKLSQYERDIILIEFEKLLVWLRKNPDKTCIEIRNEIDWRMGILRGESK
jgi:hypothetical protein